MNRYDKSIEEKMNMCVNESVCEATPHEKMSDVLIQSINFCEELQGLSAEIYKCLFGEEIETGLMREINCTQDCIEEIRRRTREVAGILYGIKEKL